MPAAKKPRHTQRDKRPAAREPAVREPTLRPAAPSRTVPSTEAQNEFGRILEEAAADRDIAITRHNVVRAVLVSAARYRQLTGAAAEPDLDALAARFDELYASMQTAKVRERTAAAVDATPEEMGRAAVAAAKRTARRRRTA